MTTPIRTLHSPDPPRRETSVIQLDRVPTWIKLVNGFAVGVCFILPFWVMDVRRSHDREVEQLRQEMQVIREEVALNGVWVRTHRHSPFGEQATLPEEKDDE